MAASVLALPLSHSTMMAASVLAHTHFNYDGSQRAGFAIWTMAASVLAYLMVAQQWQPACWLTHFNYEVSKCQCWLIPTSTMMAASALALPSGQWQPACWLTHFNYDGSQHAGLPTSTMMVANVLAFHLDNGSQQAGFHCLLSASSRLLPCCTFPATICGDLRELTWQHLRSLCLRHDHETKRA